MANFEFKIRHKFILVFASLILFPALALGLSTLSIVRTWVVKQVVSEQQLLLGSIKATIVDRHVEDMERALEALSLDPRLPLIFSDEAARTAVVEQWELMRAVFPERSWVYFGTPDNQILVSPEWIAPTEYDVRARPWYRDAVVAGDLVWIEPYSEYISSDAMMSTATPVYDGSGEFQGVLSIDTHMGVFLNLMRAKAAQHASQFAAISADGRVHVLNAESAHLPDTSLLPATLSATDELVVLDGTRYLITRLPVPKLNLTLVSLLPASRIFAEVNPILIWILLITVAFVVVALAAGFYFSRHFVGNIEELNSYMSAVAGGDYRIRYCVSGADEFYQLNARLNTLVHTIGEDIRSLRDESQTDPLCSIPNRRFVMAELDRVIEECSATREPLSVVMFDVDYFKRVNDEYGHTVGDEVLLRIARLIQGGLPQAATVGRYGGEEFLAILPGIGRSAAAKVADQVRQEIESQQWRESRLAVTMSGGVAESVPGETMETLLDRADRALYRAKDAGRNRIVAADQRRAAS